MSKTAVNLTLASSAVGMEKPQMSERKDVDVLLIGAGVMSATLGAWLQDLEPDWTIEMVERLESVAEESSNGWNNAGTGHAALAELNYTPLKADGSIDISKALTINESFQVSRQFLAWQVQKGRLHSPERFINSTPHMSFVWGEENVAFLRKRYQALQKSTLFRGMAYSEDPQQIAEWIPLVMKGRDRRQKVAATWTEMGTDVNFGEVTRQLIASLEKHHGFRLRLRQEVRDLKRLSDGRWQVTLHSLATGESRVLTAKNVFIGAGGAALPLLQKSGIPEVSGYAGFPVGGSFLVTENPDVVRQHMAKVYGKASVGAPPMSVPHVDTRVLDGKRVLLFGPFATFSTKFLKQGSLLDMFGSMNSGNLLPMMNVGLKNFDLVKYLVDQVLQSDADRMEALRTYVPDAHPDDWRLVTAGQRVQIIKKDAKEGGVLRLGTEVVASEDGSISALLGASPGASTAAPIMLELMAKAWPEQMASTEWQNRIRAVVPTWGRKLNGDVTLTEKVLADTSRVLKLAYAPPVTPNAANDEARETAHVVGK
ncbi:MAG TPA: malate dehydrogenase (quinone) [Pantoea sp.]|uniref:malate dehydrogenase (quinone) n=1 Tax=Pantoea TaxID=53335 RepID=UPI000534212F|nr:MULTISPECIES: malate dehydrogenase (quinone) [Pantoea]MDU6387032.1 malate dehydrogenase (quinone) [Pantoea sp.]PNK62356.1 malate dehydrogenase (quinone) [Pantoea sp. FDAARGOS_194]HAK34202.1 malate dehydrogenase (quinone) [Pantoea sp.]